MFQHIMSYLFNGEIKFSIVNGFLLYETTSLQVFSACNISKQNAWKSVQSIKKYICKYLFVFSKINTNFYQISFMELEVQQPIIAYRPYNIFSFRLVCKSNKIPPNVCCYKTQYLESLLDTLYIFFSIKGNIVLTKQFSFGFYFSDNCNKFK